jgi:hypothetical protein
LFESLRRLFLLFILIIIIQGEKGRLCVVGGWRGRKEREGVWVVI